jgi:uncharacterized membrane protein
MFSGKPNGPQLVTDIQLAGLEISFPKFLIMAIWQWNPAFPMIINNFLPIIVLVISSPEWYHFP